jgi:hypothetical protein
MSRLVLRLRREILPPAVASGTVFFAVWAMAACSADEPTASRAAPPARFGKAAPEVTVTATNPDSAFQGDSGVAVHVTGSGFAPGARAQWQLAGDTTHIKTLSTTYVSPKEVVAVIKVDANAPVASYDVAVLRVDGKKGVGAELFAVKLRGNVDDGTRARFSWDDSINVGTVSAPAWVPAAIRGDGRLRDGSPAVAGGPSNEYQGNFCSVSAVIGSGTGNESAQMYIDPDRFASASLPASCQPTRYYRFYVNVNGPTQTPSVVHPSHIVPDLSLMAVGETRVQSFHVGTMEELGFAIWWDPAYPPATGVLVTRLPNVIDELGRSVRRWRVETWGTHQAVLVVPNSGKKPGSTVTSTFYSAPWAMTVTEVPYPFPTFP